MKLYKYTKFDVGCSILESSHIALSKPEWFNDPFDCMAIATVASKKLVSRYTAHLSKRGKGAEDSKKNVSFSIENITTDDEKILLYYIVSAKTRKITKPTFSNWLIQNELHGIRVDNAFDLLSSIGSSKMEGEELNLDMGLFRRCTINTEKLLEELNPIP